MAIRTYKVTLDSKNTIAPEPVFLRQGDKTGAVVIDAILMDNGAPVSLEGLTPMFKANTVDGKAVIIDSTGFNIVNASGGEFTYQVPNALSAVPGKIVTAYFSLSDTSGSESTFDVAFIIKKAVDITKSQADDYIAIIDGTLDSLRDQMDSLKIGFNTILNNYNTGNFYNKSETDSKDSITLSSAKAYTDNSLKGISSVPETFANLDAIKAKYPNGANGVMVAADNGHKYIWSNDNWQDAGIYQAVGIANGSITNDKLAAKSVTSDKLDQDLKTSIIIGSPGVNLLDPAKITAGFYIDDNGIVNQAEDWYASDFVPVKINTDYHTNVSCLVFFYDSDKSFISHTAAGMQFKTPPNANYAKFSIIKNNLIKPEDMMLSESTEKVAYKPFSVELDGAKIKDDTIGKAKLNFPMIPVTEKRSLHEDLTDVKDSYIDFTSGNLFDVKGFYATDFIDITGNTKYTKNDGQQLAFYDVNKRYISGLQSATSFTTPNNAMFVRISINAKNYDHFALYQGDLDYKQFGLEFGSDVLLFSNNVITVGKHGCNFETITAALNTIPSGNKTVPLILVMPGKYEESLNGAGKKFCIKGLDRDNTIIFNYLNDYYNPPVDAGPGNYFKNLTIIADDNGSTTPENGVNNLPAYAVHIDLAGRGLDFSDLSYQGETIFRNCKLIAKHQHAAGIGIIPNQSLIMENCEFIAYNVPALRVHDYMPEGGSAPQRFLLRNSIIHTIGTGHALALQDPSHYGGGNDSDDCIFSFQNNIIYNDTMTDLLSTHTPTAVENISGIIKLGLNSFGNNVEKLNRPAV